MAEMYSEQRNVALNLTTNDLCVIAEEIGTWDKLWAAIGYLSSWNTNYPSVTISRDGGADLVAIYRDKTANKMYVIGAVWNGTDYGFHS